MPETGGVTNGGVNFRLFKGRIGAGNSNAANTQLPRAASVRHQEWRLGVTLILACPFRLGGTRDGAPQTQTIAASGIGGRLAKRGDKAVGTSDGPFIQGVPSQSDAPANSAKSGSRLVSQRVPVRFGRALRHAQSQIAQRRKVALFAFAVSDRAGKGQERGRKVPLSIFAA